MQLLVVLDRGEFGWNWMHGWISRTRAALPGLDVIVALPAGASIVGGGTAGQRSRNLPRPAAPSPPTIGFGPGGRSRSLPSISSSVCSRRHSSSDIRPSRRLRPGCFCSGTASELWELMPMLAQRPSLGTVQYSTQTVGRRRAANQWLLHSALALPISPSPLFLLCAPFHPQRLPASRVSFLSTPSPSSGHEMDYILPSHQLPPCPPATMQYHDRPPITARTSAVETRYHHARASPIPTGHTQACPGQCQVRLYKNHILIDPVLVPSPRARQALYDGINQARRPNISPQCPHDPPTFHTLPRCCCRSISRLFFFYGST